MNFNGDIEIKLYLLPPGFSGYQKGNICNICLCGSIYCFAKENLVSEMQNYVPLMLRHFVCVCVFFIGGS